MFYRYSQNNSGGSFIFDEDAGITHHVVIEADSARVADEIAEEIGIYFDGCQSMRDCPCCGDRWYSAYSSGDKVPMVYGEILGVKSNRKWPSRWMQEGYETVVHFKNGTKKWYDADCTFTKEV